MSLSPRMQHSVALEASTNITLYAQLFAVLFLTAKNTRGIRTTTLTHHAASRSPSMEPTIHLDEVLDSLDAGL